MLARRRARREGQDGRHGVRQDPAQLLHRKDKRADASPKDLEGKTIGAPPGDGQRQAWPAFAKLHKIDESKVTWVNIEPSAKIAALAEKRVDVVGDYTTGMPFYEKAMGAGNVAMMPWADTGFDMYSMSIMASEKTMKERPKVLKAFLEAAYMGWRDVMSRPEGVARDLQEARARDRPRDHRAEHDARARPDAHEELCRQGHRLDRRQEDVRLGRHSSTPTWASPKKVECKDVYTTEFLTKVAMPLAVK